MRRSTRRDDNSRAKVQDVCAGSSAEILKVALALPTEARAALAGLLLESLDAEVDEDADAAWATEVNRRIAEFDSGASKTIPWAKCAADSPRDDAFRDGFDDLLVYFINGEIALDENDAAWIAPGDLTILLPNALEEFTLLRLEAIFVVAGLGDGTLVAPTGAGEA